MSKPRANTGFTRDAWREHKIKHGIVTHWDKNKGFWLPPPRPRSEDAIRAEAVSMLSAQMRAQRARWGFA